MLVDDKIFGKLMLKMATNAKKEKRENDEVAQKEANAFLKKKKKQVDSINPMTTHARR